MGGTSHKFKLDLIASQKILGDTEAALDSLYVRVSITDMTDTGT